MFGVAILWLAVGLLAGAVGGVKLALFTLERDEALRQRLFDYLHLPRALRPKGPGMVKLVECALERVPAGDERDHAAGQIVGFGIGYLAKRLGASEETATKALKQVEVVLREGMSP